MNKSRLKFVLLAMVGLTVIVGSVVALKLDVSEGEKKSIYMVLALIGASILYIGTERIFRSKKNNKRE